MAGCGSSDSATSGTTGAGGSGAAGAGAGGGGTGGTGVGGAGGAAGGAAGAGGASGSAGAAGAGGSAPAGKSRLRMAHLAPNVSVKVRVCATAKGATAATELTAGVSGGLAYPNVSAYVDVPEGTYDLKVVDAAGDCTAAALVSAAGVAIPNGGTFTAVVSGDATSADAAKKPNLRLLSDEGATAATHVRLVHASAGAPAIDVGAYAGVAFAKIFASVSYDLNDGLAVANTNATTPVDAGGYATIPLALDTAAVFEVRLAATGSVYASLTSPAPLPIGTVATLFAHGTLVVDAGGNASGVSALMCFDGKEAAGLTTCAPLVAAAAAPARPVVRLAHVSPDAAAKSVDVCAKPSSYAKWLADDSQSIAKAIGYKTVTTNLPSSRLPADVYDVKLVVHATPTDCSKDAIDAGLTTTGLALDGAARTTLAATGLVAAGVNHFALKAYTNKDTTTETANASVRTVHAAAGIAAVDIGPLAGAFLWSDVSYGAAGDYKATLLSGGDRVGINYQSTADYDLATAPLTAAESTVKGNVYTVWAIGDGTAGSTNMAPLAMLICEETPAAAGASLTCHELPLAAP